MSTDLKSNYDSSVVDNVVKRRTGQILSRDCVLLLDRTKKKNLSLTPRIHGTKNFRKAPNSNIYGVSQLSQSSAQTICQLLGAKYNKITGERFGNTQKLILCNLRDEPVVFINGQSFTVRKLDAPLEPLQDFNGISGARLDEMEEKLKQDILSEIFYFRGLILIHSSSGDELTSSWLYVSEDGIFTTQEIIAQLKENCFLVEYYRLPLVTQPPLPTVLDKFLSLAQYIFANHSPQEVGILFYCFSGSGRTTFAMCLLSLIVDNLFPAHVAPLDEPMLVRSGSRVALEYKKEQGVYSDYRPILDLVRTLSYGQRNKEQVDTVIDQIAAVCNLREKSSMLFRQSKDIMLPLKARNTLVQNALYYLQRYFLLITFAAYMSELTSKKNSPGDMNAEVTARQIIDISAPTENSDSYSKWFEARGELASILHSMTRNRDYALETMDWSIPIDAKEESAMWTESGGDEKLLKDLHLLKSIAAMRSGSVLSQAAILKEFKLNSTETITCIPGYPIYLAGQLNGKTLLKFFDTLSSKSHSRCSPTGLSGSGGIPKLRPRGAELDPGTRGESIDAIDSAKEILFVNLRLDPVIFIEDSPFLLRTRDNHMSNLVVAGISAERIEYMELRLKLDIEREASNYDSRVVVHREVVQDPHQPSGSRVNETLLRPVPHIEVVESCDNLAATLAAPNPSACVKLVPRWVAVHENSVKTLRELCDDFNRKKSPLKLSSSSSRPRQETTVNYCRAPCSSGEILGLGLCFDRLQFILLSKNSNDPIVFSTVGGFKRCTIAACASVLIQNIQAYEAKARENGNSLSSKPLLPKPPEQSKRPRGYFTVVRTIFQILPNGEMNKRQVDSAIEICSEKIHILNSIYSYRKLILSESDAHRKSEYLAELSYMIYTYTLLLLLASHTHILIQQKTIFSFAHWIESRTEFDHLFEMILKDPLSCFVAPSSGLKVDRSSTSRSASVSEGTSPQVSPELPHGRGRDAKSPAIGISSRAHTKHESSDTPFANSPPESLSRIINRRLPLEVNGQSLAAPSVQRRVESSYDSEDGTDSDDDGLFLRSSVDAPISKDDYDTIILARKGMVLQGNMILKSDHFPGCHKAHLPVVEGAPNFRKVEGIPVYGVGIPSANGLSSVLKEIQAQGYQRIVWFCLREELLVYLNGLPFVLRDRKKPFRNFEYPFISGQTVEDMENRLKQDILAESANYNNTILITFEEGKGKLTEMKEITLQDRWEPLDEIKSPFEMYRDVALACQVDLKYYRVPVTDERAMKFIDFEEITQIIEKIFLADLDKELKTAIVFNCQMGQGRTTSGMTVCTLLWQLRDRAWLTPKRPRQELIMTEKELMEVTTMGIVKDDQPRTQRDVYLQGEFQAIVNLQRAVRNGREAKVSLDLAIDKCAAVQNLRECIYNLYVSSQQNPQYAQAALNFLERYFYLLLFSMWVKEKFDKVDEVKINEKFVDWIKERPELTNLLNDLSLE